MSTDTKVPKTLPAKNIKLASFINFYNQKLIDNGISDKDTLNSIFKIFDNNVPDIISLQNQYLDYETSHIQQYKKQYKLHIQNHKELDKQNKKYDKELHKWNNKFHKLFHKTISNDPNFRQHILDIIPFNLILDTLPPSTEPPLIRLQKLNLLQSTNLANLSLRYQILPPNLPNKPTNITHNTPLSLASTVEEKVVDKNNELKDVTILELDSKKYLCDINNNIYDFKTHGKIGTLNSDDTGVLQTPITINFD